MAMIEQIQERWRGWTSISIRTASLHARIVPEIGGRMMEYQLGEHTFLWFNPHLSATSSTESSEQWMNWGGDKVWLAPQGWGTEDQWPGPPDPVLDGGPYHAEVEASSTEVLVRLTSQADRRSGVQVSRTLRFGQNTTVVEIACTMTNIDSRPRRWGLWPVTQIDAASRQHEGYNTTLRACVPLRKVSAYREGYRVIYGESANPQYKVVGNILEVSYQHEVGKIGADSDAGWTAVIDGESGAVLVMQMTFEADAVYPDGASVEIWTNGLGMLTAYGRTEPMPESLHLNPYMMECELVSPFAQMAPGESYDFAYTLAATNIGADDSEPRGILRCNAFGCEVESFSITAGGEVSGRFGVFSVGSCLLEFVDEHETVVGFSHVATASPMEPLILHGFVAVPPGATSARLVLHATDSEEDAPVHGRRIGEVARVALPSAISSC